jgi:hypothetical protein
LTSRKRSAASSRSKRPSPTPPSLFIDRSLGKFTVATALRAQGVEVHTHDAHFPQDARDEQWLANVGQRGLGNMTAGSERRVRVAHQAGEPLSGYGAIAGKAKRLGFDGVSSLRRPSVPAGLAAAARDRAGNPASCARAGGGESIHLPPVTIAEFAALIDRGVAEGAPTSAAHECGTGSGGTGCTVNPCSSRATSRRSARLRSGRAGDRSTHLFAGTGSHDRDLGRALQRRRIRGGSRERLGGSYFLCIASMRFFISSGLTSSLCVERCQLWPNGSFTVPERSP